MELAVVREILNASVTTGIILLLVIIAFRAPAAFSQVKAVVDAWNGGQERREQLQLDAERERGERLARANAAMKTSNEAMAATMQSLQALMADREELAEARYRALMERVDQMGERHRERADELAAQIAALQRANEQLRRQLAAVEADREQVARERDEARQQVEKLESEVEALTRKVAGLERQRGGRRPGNMSEEEARRT